MAIINKNESTALLNLTPSVRPAIFTITRRISTIIFYFQPNPDYSKIEKYFDQLKHHKILIIKWFENYQFNILDYFGSAILW